MSDETSIKASDQGTKVEDGLKASEPVKLPYESPTFLEVANIFSDPAFGAQPVGGSHT
jgi:hypothetical protein